MQRRVAVYLAVLLVLAPIGRVTLAQVPRSGPGWPEPMDAQWSADKLAFDPQLASEVPACVEETPMFSSGGTLGPLRIGQALEEVEQVCPKLIRGWDWGYEGIPVPVAVVRLGEAAVVATLEDTLPDSAIQGFSSGSRSLQTTEGVGPGSPLSKAVDAYGAPELYEGECLLYAQFTGLPELVFVLEMPEASGVACVDIPRLADADEMSAVPEGTRLRTVQVLPPNGTD